MSDQTDAIVRIGLEPTFEELLRELGSLEHDLFRSELLEDSVFIDNIILRLRIWASEINIQDGTLGTISKIGPLATTIQSRLDAIRSLTKSARTSSTQKQTLSENKDQFLRPMDSLAMFIEPIKTIMTQNPTDENDYVSSLEAHLRTSQIRQLMGEHRWYWLATPVERGGFSRQHGTEEFRFQLPLGAIVTDPAKPAVTQISHLSALKPGKKPTTEKLYDRASRPLFRVPPEVFVTVLASPKSAFKTIEINRTRLRNMVEMRQSSTAFLVTGVMSATHVSLDHIKPHSSLFEEIMQAHLNGSRVGAESSSSSQKNITIDVDDTVIFALRYQAFRFKRFSKKLELVDFDTKYNDVGDYAKIRQKEPSSAGYMSVGLVLLVGQLLADRRQMRHEEHRRTSTRGKSSDRRDTGQSGQGERLQEVDV